MSRHPVARRLAGALAGAAVLGPLAALAPTPADAAVTRASYDGNGKQLQDLPWSGTFD